MQGLVATEKDNDKLLENGRDIARGLWEQLRDQAGENDSLGGIRGTVDRIVTRLREMVKGMQDAKIAAEAKKEETNAALDDYENQLYERAIAAGVDESSAKAAAQAAREMSGHVTFTTTPEGKLKKVDEGDDDGLLPSPVAKLLKESQGMWSEVRADESINALLKEEIAPGFENLIRSAVEVVCEMMSTLELPRVDGVYDSPLGSVCYHVDNLQFSEFAVAEDGLKVESATGANETQTGFGSTVSIDGIRTVMKDIKFAYCEFPKGWGMVDGEGLCTVKVDGARVAISYDIVVNTEQLMKLVNQGVELSKDESKLTSVKEKVQAKWAARQAATAPPPAAPAASEPQKSPKGAKKKHSSGAKDHAAADAALDKAFSFGGIFGAGGDDGSETDSSIDHDDFKSPTGAGLFSSMFSVGESDEDEEEYDEAHANVDAAANEDDIPAEQKAKLEQHRALLRELLGDEFVLEEPILELRVHGVEIAVGQLDVEIGGTSAAWLYNMIALVLTQQLRGTIEDRINGLTVRQLARLSGTVEAYSAGLVKVCVVTDDHEEEEEEQSMLGSWVSGGGLGKLRKDCGEWGVGWRCEHWKEGRIIRRTPSSVAEIVNEHGEKVIMVAGKEMGDLTLDARE